MLRLKEMRTSKYMVFVIEDDENPDVFYDVIVGRAWGMFRVKVQKREYGREVETTQDLELT